MVLNQNALFVFASGRLHRGHEHLVHALLGLRRTFQKRESSDRVGHVLALLPDQHRFRPGDDGGSGKRFFRFGRAVFDGPPLFAGRRRVRKTRRRRPAAVRSQRFRFESLVERDAGAAVRRRRRRRRGIIVGPVVRGVRRARH